MTILVHWESADRLLEDEAVIAAAHAALDHGGLAGAGLNIVMIDDEQMIELHREHLDDPTPTDVITFDLREQGEAASAELPAELAELLADEPIGELFVGVEMAGRVAKQRQVSPARELALYIVHGVLHLCGWDDVETEDRARMRIAESTVMECLGFAPDSAPHERD